MFRNYFIIALRNIARQKSYTFINITGLSLGIALFILLLLFVQFEFSYDSFNKHYNNIYRVEEDYAGRGQFIALTNNPIGPVLVEDYPEIINQVRLRQTGNRVILDAGSDRKFFEDSGWWTENSIFEIFTFEFVQGNPSTALKEPNSIVLTETTASKYFPDGDAVGQTILVNNNYNCKVTAILRDSPGNSHLSFNYFISFNTYENEISQGYLSNWNVLGVYTYVLADEIINPSVFNAKVKDLLRRKQSEDIPSDVYIKPMSEIHLYSNVLGEIGRRGDIETIIIFTAIGLFILLIASINFMNLSTARSMKRAREVGMRKISGARRIDLIIQFISESVLLSLISLLIAIAVIYILLPEFNSIVNRQISFDIIGNGYISAGIIAVGILVGVLSGIYPSFYLSRFNPVKILRSNLRAQSKKISQRDVLVIFQFAISVFLIVGTLAVYNQLNFLREKDTGYDKDDIISISYNNVDSATSYKYEVYKEDILNLTGVSSAAISQFAPHFNGASIQTGYEGAADGKTIYTNLNHIDRDFLETYGIRIKSGMNFLTAEPDGEGVTNVLINEAFADKAGWDEPFGKRIGPWRVHGVIKNYNFTSLKNVVLPLILKPINTSDTRFNNRELLLSIRFHKGTYQETIDQIKSRFEKYFPNDIFEYRYFADDFGLMLRNEERTAKTAGYFSILAIFISCLGLFGLSSFVAEQKQKEIGIRKVLGSSVAGVVFILTGNIIRLIVIANLLAWPLIYFAVEEWLENFAYRIDIDLMNFVIAAAASIFIGAVSVTFQTVKAATANPVESLKSE